MEEKIKDNVVVKSLSQIARDSKDCTPVLVGGAVVDIIDGKEPKDYDIIVYGDEKQFVKSLEKCGYRFLMESKTAITYFNYGIEVQLLKTNIKDFDFTVSQSNVNLIDMSMDLAKHEIENKLLIPVNFNDKKLALNTLARLPHWMKKGYKIHEKTYFTILNKLSKDNSQKIKQVSFPCGS